MGNGLARRLTVRRQRYDSRNLGEFGEVGDSQEELADFVQQGKAIIPDCLILDHHHDLIEEFINRFLHLGHLEE